jgi:hypothetical protein
VPHCGVTGGRSTGAGQDRSDIGASGEDADVAGLWSVITGRTEPLDFAVLALSDPPSPHHAVGSRIRRVRATPVMLPHDSEARWSGRRALRCAGVLVRPLHGRTVTLRARSHLREGPDPPRNQTASTASNGGSPERWTHSGQSRMWARTNRITPAMSRSARAPGRSLRVVQSLYR